MKQAGLTAERIVAPAAQPGGTARRSAALCAFISLLAAPTAHAQVDMDEMGAAGELALEVHAYDALSPSQPDATGDPIGVMPEITYSFAPGFDVVAHLSLADLDRDETFGAGGVRLRFKYVVPNEAEGLFGALNLEIGHVDKRLDPNPWNAQLKGIVGAREGRWTLAANFNVDWAVSGPEPGPATLEVAGKVAYGVGRKTSVGFESYNDFGPLRNFTAFDDGDHSLYAVVDTEIGAWEFNIAAGYGYGGPEDRWVFRMIIGVPLGGRFPAL